jgi:hypothetical protein
VQADLYALMTSPALFGSTFGGDSWKGWPTFARVAEGLALTDEQADIFQRCTGRTTPPSKPFTNIFTLAGRRSGKSHITALLGVREACFRPHRVAAGEHPTVLVIAVDKAQAQVVFGYIEGLLRSCPVTAPLIDSVTAEQIRLKNGVNIQVRAADYRGVRGVTLAAAVVDELAFLPSEQSSTPDVELYRALEPGLLTLNGRFVGISSPWTRRGLAFQMWRRHWGQDDSSTLVWFASSREMNPSLPAERIRRALEDGTADDTMAARAEYGLDWRSDIEAYLPEELLESVVVPGRVCLPPQAGRLHVGFIDASAGRQDSFCLAIAHAEQTRNGTIAVLDHLSEARPPFGPADITRQYAETLRHYGLTTATADRFGGIWVQQAFQENGITVEQAAEPKTKLYAALAQLVTSGRVELLDNRRLLTQLSALERRVSRSGNETIAEPQGRDADGAPRAHDDAANVAAGALTLAVSAGSWERIWTFDCFADRERRGAASEAERAYAASLQPACFRRASGEPRDAQGRLLNAKGEVHLELHVGRGTGIIRYEDEFR